MGPGSGEVATGSADRPFDTVLDGQPDHRVRSRLRHEFPGQHSRTTAKPEQRNPSTAEVSQTEETENQQPDRPVTNRPPANTVSFGTNTITESVAIKTTPLKIREPSQEFRRSLVMTASLLAVLLGFHCQSHRGPDLSLFTSS